MTGRIERIVREKALGFIEGEDGNDYVFHRSSLRDVSFDDLHEGPVVTFYVVKGPQELRAEVVRLRAVVIY